MNKKENIKEPNSIEGKSFIDIIKGENVKLKIPSIFGANMVLQQEQEIPVWGLGKDGKTVTVSLNKSKVSTIIKDGKWVVTLPPQVVGGPYELKIETQNEMIRYDNVLIGDVWVCSGQSNMWWPVCKSDTADEDLSDVNYPNIRLFTCGEAGDPEPQFDVVLGRWNECNKNIVKDFSAVAYHFGIKLVEDLKVPIGLVRATYSGTYTQSWVSKEIYESDKDYEDHIHKRACEKYKENPDNYSEIYSAYNKKLQKTLNEGTEIPEPLSVDLNFIQFSYGGKKCPSYQYNAMIKPLQPFAIKGVIWYQGEGNTEFPKQHRKLFPALIKGWRKDWGQGDFPFLFVQLPGFKGEPRNDWALFRETQLDAWENINNTGMAITIDIGNEDDIHPTQKKTVGVRLALLATSLVYDRDIIYSGPVYDSYEIQGNQMIISFKYIGKGLVVANDSLNGFEICGMDGEYTKAIGKIYKDKVIVWNDNIKEPKDVRYAWKNYPEFSLFNSEGLPASPFRTNRL